MHFIMMLEGDSEVNLIGLKRYYYINTKIIKRNDVFKPVDLIFSYNGPMQILNSISARNAIVIWVFRRESKRKNYCCWFK